MRPIVWGFILTVVGAFFWIVFSVVFGVTAGLAGYTSFEEIPILWQMLVIVSGLAMLFSLPISVVVEIIQYLKRKKE